MKNTKLFTIFAGVNGAGKSTLYGSENKPELGVRLNSDEMLHAAGLDWQDPHAQLQAGKKLLNLQKDCLKHGKSFNQETTLSGNTILSAIKTAKKLGYEIHLRYVGVNSPEIAKERVKKRIALGGHGVPDETIERRFETSKENFIKIFPLCDSVILYDNSGKQIVMVAYLLNGKLCRTSLDCKWADELIKQLN